MKKLTRREFVQYSAAGVLSMNLGLHYCARKGDVRPNFVFFMTDDQRWDAMSCAGNTILQTPNMDRIAEEGAHFQNMFVTTSLCSPSRASILTGKYSHNHGVTINDQQRDEGRLSLDHIIFPEMLQQAGYETAFIGKWHMPVWGRDRNFDYYFGFKGQGRYDNPLIAENQGEDTEYKGHITDVITDKAIEFLRKPHDKPFCLLLWFKAPHRSWIAAQRFQHLFQDVKFPRPKTWDTGYAGKPDAVKNADMKIGDFGRKGS